MFSQCDVQPSALSSNAAPVNSTVVTGSWTYFVISASARSFTVTAQETQGNNGETSFWRVKIILFVFIMIKKVDSLNCMLKSTAFPLIRIIGAETLPETRCITFTLNLLLQSTIFFFFHLLCLFPNFFLLSATTVLVGVRGSGIGPEHGSTPFKISAFVSF